MTDAIGWAAPAAAVVAALVVPAIRERQMAVANWVAAAIIAAVGAVVVGSSIAATTGSGQAHELDVVGAVFLAVGVVVGAASAVLAPTYLRHRTRGFFGSGPRWYYFAFYLLWAMLLAIPTVQNLGIAWVLVGVSTGVTCLLVAYSGTGRALEAGWKYLILTTLGLVVALMGILILYSSAERPGDSLAALNWSAMSTSATGVPHDAAVVAIIFITVGFAAKIGWAPVHHWLPDAHSEAPAPVSAMLSAALLPMVILVV
ncbi:MAG: proton-conducting transporter membrane subunit, partial [Actinomycetes bacterium]